MSREREARRACLSHSDAEELATGLALFDELVAEPSAWADACVGTGERSRCVESAPDYAVPLAAAFEALGGGPLLGKRERNAFHRAEEKLSRAMSAVGVEFHVAGGPPSAEPRVELVRGEACVELPPTDSDAYDLVRETMRRMGWGEPARRRPV